ncbi:Transient receptor potential-gamma protein [Mytilus edulis]|uniref:Transient receptor potential-gamma protein n=1 Tax=Mytilus edulis TaxID=6550 RepID=A0A8S3TMB0_MYTED|nr:Transient receptor potential-gamma protein [Mytilus edulis]
MFFVDLNNSSGGRTVDMSNMSNKLLPCIVYNSPYNSPSRGVDYSGGTAEHKRASTMPSQGSLFTNFEDIQLTDEERVYLNAASLGDVGIVRQSLEEKGASLNVNCLDYMGRNALHLAIDSEKLYIIEMLLDNLSFNCIEEALLHAISKGGQKIVKIIIEHPTFIAGEDRFKRSGVNEAFFRTEEKSQFPPDITPLILAASYNNHEIVQMFLSRNHRIEKPHPIYCKCTDCVIKQNYDSLKRSRSRLNAYRALSSPAYMALSSPDPIMTTFELRQEMMKLAENEYHGLVVKCMDFACELMDLCRGTQEVEAVLSEGTDSIIEGSRDLLARLKMAIRYQEKKLGAVMRCPVTKFITHTTSHVCFLILLAAATFRLAESGISITSTKEFTDPAFIHLSKDEKINSLLKETLRPANTLLTRVQFCIVFWILGLLWIECKQLYCTGAHSYLTDYYNFMDFSVISMYLASYVLRFYTEIMVSNADREFNGAQRANDLLRQDNYTYFDLLLAEIKNPRYSPQNYFMEASRFHWKADDPEIVSDVLFAIANVISFARTTFLMPAFEVLGPLQISLGRMIGDITRFMVLFTLVLFAFMVGLHNLYWYYGAQRIKMVMGDQTAYVHAAEAFQGLKQTFYSLFWSMFGQVSINDISVKHPGPDGVFTAKDPNNVMESSTSIVEGVGTYLFGIYHVVIIIVLINMLIAMMSHSFEDIQTDCDVEWKFARTKLWMNYMDDGSTLPVPFNMIPTPKSIYYIWRSFRFLFSRKANGDWLDYQRARKKTFIKRRREIVCKTLELKTEETTYTEIMQRLVKRYLFKLERARDEKEMVNVPALRTEEVEIVDTNDAPPPVPDTPNRIPYATPPIHEEEDEISCNQRSGKPGLKRKTTARQQTRRVSNSVPSGPTTLVIPQLDAIQRSQKLLDVRLQHLQASSKENNRIIDDVEFLRKVMTENQKALYNIIQALGNMQGEIVNLVKCFAPIPASNDVVPSTHQNSKSGQKKRSSHADDAESEV